MQLLQHQLANRLKENLQRKSIVSPSRWAEKYRVMGQPYPGLWTFDHHPWLREMHDSKAEYNVGQKCAQVGYTEMALNLVFYMMDVPKYDCLYILPNTKPDAADFSTGRFNKAIELSEHIKKMFTDSNNVGFKQAGSSNLYVRGSNSRTQLKSVPVSLVIFDELDEMDLDNIELAEQRTSGQLVKKIWKISTPTVDARGINKYYLESSKEKFIFKCPGCSKHIQFRFPESLVITGDSLEDENLKKSYLICTECKYQFEQDFDVPMHLAQLPKKAAIKSGHWEPERQSDIRGFNLNQMYSPTILPSTIAQRFLRSQDDTLEEQEFFNSVIGTTHTTKDAKISEEQYKECIVSGMHMETHASASRIQTMGVDIGKKIHVTIPQFEIDGYHDAQDVNTHARPRLLFAGEVTQFEDLDKLMRFYQIKYCVVDVAPETRKALEFANRFHGFVRLCRYNHHIQAKNISTTEEGELIISVNRTSWLDLTLGRFKKKQIMLPIDLPRDFQAQIQAQIRVPKREKDGNPGAFYETPGNLKDHYAHSLNYAEIALPFACGYGPVRNAGKVT